MNTMINWISKEELINFCRKEGKKYMETNFCEFSFNTKDLRKFIPVAPDEEVVEFTEPSPCLKWYGYAPFLFQLTAYLNEGKNEYSTVSLLSTESTETDWEILKDLNFPFDFIENITFIEGVRNSTYSLYLTDEYNLLFEFYRGRSRQDVESLQKFLTEHNFSRQLYIDKSEIYPADWLVFEENKNIARYGNKYTAERFALEKSRANNSVTTVYSPDISDSTTTFENGIKRNSET